MAFDFALQAPGDGLNLDGSGERAQAVAEPQKKGVLGFALAQSLTIGGLQREVEDALHPVICILRTKNAGDSDPKPATISDSVPPLIPTAVATAMAHWERAQKSAGRELKDAAK